MSSTFLFYDLETFGLNSHYDRIAQAAAVRTDMDLNIIGAPLLLYSKLSPDYLPNPESCLVTGITPQTVNAKGMPEAEMIKTLVNEMMRSNTITCGYNSIKFDDECIRTTLYRNLYDPYEREYKNGCSRWDIINLVRATRDLRPEGLIFTKKNEEGFTSFKLTDLTEENNIEQVGAHDALVDVYATINLAKLIKEKQPKLFQWAFEHRSRESIKEIVDPNKREPFLSTCGAFSSTSGSTRPLLPLFYVGKNDLWCFDLTYPLPNTVTLDNYKESGIFRLSTNKCPFVAPINTLSKEAEKRLGFTKNEVLKLAKEIYSMNIFKKEDFKANTYENNNQDTDPDLSIYGSFLSNSDRNRLLSIQNLSPRAKLRGEGSIPFDDPKYHKLVWRQVARNWPECLDEQGRIKWKNWCTSRLLSPPVKEANTIETYLKRCREIFDSLDTNGNEKKIVRSLIEYGEYLQKTIIDGDKNE